MSVEGTDLAKIKSLENVNDINQGLKIFKWLEKNCFQNLTSEYEMRMKISWCRRMILSTHFDGMSTRPILIFILQKLINESEHLPTCHILSKFELAKIYVKSGESELVFEILSPHLENHYGLLPEIVQLFFLTDSSDSFTKKWLELYQNTKEFLESKNYDCIMTQRKINHLFFSFRSNFLSTIFILILMLKNLWHKKENAQK